MEIYSYLKNNDIKFFNLVLRKALLGLFKIIN